MHVVFYLVGMRGRNYSICHNCRSTYHFFEECKKKLRSPWCVDGVQKCFEVEKEGKSKGQLFRTYSVSCGYFHWVKVEEAIGELSTIDEAIGESSTIDEVIGESTTIDKAIDESNIVENLPSML